MSNPVLQALKTVEERITGNYTSGQLFEVLDKMLYRAINPLITNTHYVDRLLGIILAWYAQNHRRRISSHSKKRLTTYIVAFLAESNPRRRIQLFRRLRLERNITFFIVRHWLKIIDPWKSLHLSSCMGQSKRQLEFDLGAQCCVLNHGKLWATISEASYWVDEASSFKEQMVEKYMRKVMVDAQLHWKMQRQNNPQIQIDLGELAQNFLLAVMKAIDKFDERQGTLTTYVDNWLKNAKITQQFRGEYGTAYSIPHSKKTSIAKSKDTTTRNLSVSIDSKEALELADDRSIESSLQQQQELQRVRQIAKASDPTGIGRLLLGIPEVLSSSELKLLNAARVTQRAIT